MMDVDKHLETCPACLATPFDHAAHPELAPPAPRAFTGVASPAGTPIRGHGFRFDKWSLEGPVVWRCDVCNAVAELCSREQFRAAVDGGFAHLPHHVRLQRLLSEQLAIDPCDICGGSGHVARGDDAEAARVTRQVARRAARSMSAPLPSVGPLTRARDLAVLSVCPRCRRNDRSVPVVHVIGTDARLARLSSYGEVIVDSCVGEAAHYCGRCDLLFGDAWTELMAGLQADVLTQTDDPRSRPWTP